MKANEIKRLVTGGKTAAQLKSEPAKLSISEFDGALWACNRYWITPAAHVALLLEEYNLSAGQPGTFDVTGSVRKISDQGPDLGKIVGKPKDYPEEITPVRLGLYAAHVRPSTGQLLAVYQTENKVMTGLPADALAWLTDLSDMQMSYPRPFDLGPDDAFGDVRVMSNGSAGSTKVLLVADVIRTIKPADYSGPAHLRAEAKTENLGPRMIGLVMSVRVEE